MAPVPKMEVRDELNGCRHDEMKKFVECSPVSVRNTNRLFLRDGGGAEGVRKRPGGNRNST